MTEEKLYAMAERYQTKADRAYQVYQETGITRYDRERRNAEELADALRMAASAADEHTQLIGLRAELYSLAIRAQSAGDDPAKLEMLRQSLLAVARVHRLIGKEEQLPCM